MSGVLLDYLIESAASTVSSSRVSHVIYRVLVACVAVALLYSFYLFAPLVYGFEGQPSSDPQSKLYAKKWLTTWDF